MKKIKKYSIINFICVLIIVASKMTQTFIFNSSSNLDRKTSLIIGLVLLIPAFVLSLISFIIIGTKYYNSKEKLELKKLYLLIPFILLMIFMIYFGVSVFFKSL
ncbi:MAG: hypothetical protein HRT69_16905 [Flavobacteriaceae bacterium]|nr:hypothetical protein [Flavobacteriaceae bacterium]